MNTRAVRSLANAAILCTLAACGGGGDSAGPVSGTTNTTGWTAGVYLPAASFKNQCATPRSGSSASTGRAFADVQGSVTSENHWLRSWSNDLYLWYSEVADLNPANYLTADYFELLKTRQTTPSGAAKDRFHFSLPTDAWESFSQSGTTAGYGAQFFVLADRPPREVIVAFTEPNSPAAGAGLVRGDAILSIDGVDAINADSAAAVDTLNAGLSPATAGETHSFTLSNAGSTRQVTMSSANVTSTPVQNVHAIATPSGNVGYLLFNDHIATAESQLIAAVNTLKAQHVVDLVIDLRYNGGGYLDIASEFAYMIAGASRTAGQTFERVTFNDKHTATNPVTGEALAPTGFHTQTQGFSVAPGINLPTLDLQKVYVLTTADTCSASESVINSLRGVDVEVIQIGSTTCGKPYGFYPADNCGMTYFSVQFKGVNAKQFGDYTDGFSPQNAPASQGVAVAGCEVADDFSHALGSDSDSLLQAALNYRMGASCPTLAVELGYTQQSKANHAVTTTSMGHLLRPAWRENRIMRPAE